MSQMRGAHSRSYYFYLIFIRVQEKRSYFLLSLWTLQGFCLQGKSFLIYRLVQVLGALKSHSHCQRCDSVVSRLFAWLHCMFRSSALMRTAYWGRTILFLNEYAKNHFHTHKSLSWLVKSLHWWHVTARITAWLIPIYRSKLKTVPFCHIAVTESS